MWPLPTRFKQNGSLNNLLGEKLGGKAEPAQPGSSSRCSGVSAEQDNEAIVEHALTDIGGPDCRTSGMWRMECEKQRARAIVDKGLVRQVAEWGPEVGAIVDLHTGLHRIVTYWLRDDVRALCIFDREDTQVRVYSCSQMETCVELGAAPEVVARHFFLGLGPDDMRRGIFVSMERAVHSRHVVQQGHVGLIRAQIALLCRTRDFQKDLLHAIRVLAAEFLVHDRPPRSADAFCQMSDEARNTVTPVMKTCDEPIAIESLEPCTPPPD